MSFGQAPTITFDPRNPNLSELGAETLVIGEPGEGKAYLDPLADPVYDESRKMLETEEAQKVLNQVAKHSRSGRNQPPKPNRAQRRKEQG